VVPVGHVEDVGHHAAAEAVDRGGPTGAGTGRGLPDLGVGRRRLRRRQEVGVEDAWRDAQEVAVTPGAVRVAGRPAVAVEHAAGVRVTDVGGRGTVQAGEHVVAQGLRLVGRADATRAVVDPAVGAGGRVHRRMHADDGRRSIGELCARAWSHRIGRLRRRAVGGGDSVGLDEDPEAGVLGRDRVADVLAPQQIARLGVDDRVPVRVALGEDDQRPGRHQEARREREEHLPRGDRTGDEVVILRESQPAGVVRGNGERGGVRGPAGRGQQMGDGIGRRQQPGRIDARHE